MFFPYKHINGQFLILYLHNIKNILLNSSIKIKNNMFKDQVWKRWKSETEKSEETHLKVSRAFLS